MELLDSPSEAAFRVEVRGWLADHVPAEPLPSGDTAEGFAAHLDWERTLFDARYAVVSWPEAYGGREATLREWPLLEEEHYRAGAPRNTRIGSAPAWRRPTTGGARAGPNPTPAATWRRSPRRRCATRQLAAGG